MMRLFAAIPISSEIKKELEHLYQQVQQSGADIKLVSIENLHLTVKFFGEIDEVKLPEIKQKLQEVAHSFSPFSLQLRGVGVFPSLNLMRVLWIGIVDSSLLGLLNEVNLRLDYIRKEKREVSPHLTIARIRSHKNLEQLRMLIEANINVLFGEMLVEKMILYESKLTPTGPLYSVVDEFYLSN